MKRMEYPILIHGGIGRLNKGSVDIDGYASTGQLREEGL